MQSVVNNNPIISPEDAKNVFSIIEIIAKINGEFLGNLEERMKNWNSMTTLLADILNALVCFMFLCHVIEYCL